MALYFGDFLHNIYTWKARGTEGTSLNPDMVLEEQRTVRHGAAGRFLRLRAQGPGRGSVSPESLPCTPRALGKARASAASLQPRNKP